ncbi:MAG: hypothetical protein EON84_04805 [Bradyrhizobiaceae bacterium]|nr:MAG: hypothetical protein EON84_04805 [Bradyrhizobiaceae bacterium]
MSIDTETEMQLLKLIAAAEKLRPELERRLLAHSLFSQPHFRLSCRIKSLARAYEKLAKLKLENPEARPLDVHDIIGLRVVTLFNSSLLEALDVVADTIAHVGQVGALSPFIKDRMKIWLYTARPENDPQSIRRNLDQWREQRKLAPSCLDSRTPETLYSSVHVIGACQIDVEGADRSVEQLDLPIEIQLRTAMEDVWGQLSHVTAYPRQATNPSTLAHLNALKQLIDGCALYADLIKTESDLQLLGLREAREAPKSVGDLSLRMMTDVPQDIIDAFDDALGQRQRAEKLDEKDNVREFQAAAVKFGRIEERLRAEKELSDPVKADAIYRTQMERAFCLLYSDDPTALDEALALYMRLAKIDGTDAVCRLRLGQALREKGEIEEATVWLLQAAQIFAQNRDKRVAPDNWVRGAVHVELANAQWLIGLKTDDPNERQRTLRTAVAQAKLAVDTYRNTDADQDILLGAINNALYYAWEEHLKYDTSSIADEELARLTAELSADKIHLMPLYKQDAVFDTVQRMHWYLGNDGMALKFAYLVVDAIRKKVKRRTGDAGDLKFLDYQMGLTADELDSYVYALEKISANVKPDPVPNGAKRLPVRSRPKPKPGVAPADLA